MKNTHCKLTAPERKLIATWLEKGISNKEVGRRLCRHPTTIANEIKRNSFKYKYYEPLHAQERAEKRKKRAWKAKQPLKNKHVYSYVMERLKWGWSPEQISGRLKKDYSNDEYWHISHEAIYQYIYHPDNKEKSLWEYLRRKQRRRVKKHGRKSQRVQIPDRVSIHDRPKVIDQRKQVGHWEGDSIVGKDHQNGLHTEYERVMSFTRIEKLNRLNSDETVKAFNQIFNPLPKNLKRSTTLDNGLEMTQHLKLRNKGTMTYFADPYASHQRGGNENANLWIRYYFPKGTDFSKVSIEEIKEVEWELNNRPRKRLNYSTPQELFNNYLKGRD
jgi:transposase, IS30 family